MKKIIIYVFLFLFVLIVFSIINLLNTYFSERVEYYIENKDKWNKRWWEEKEVEYQKLYDAIKSNDVNYIQQYKKDKRRKTCSEFRV